MSYLIVYLLVAIPLALLAWGMCAINKPGEL